MKGIYWLQIFIVPVIILGAVALFVYSSNHNLVIAFLILGFLLGIFFAEYIQKKYGLDKFFAGLYSSEQDN